MPLPYFSDNILPAVAAPNDVLPTNTGLIQGEIKGLLREFPIPVNLGGSPRECTQVAKGDGL